MKRPLLLISLALGGVVVWAMAGFYAGLYLSDYDDLCTRHYETYTLKTDFVSTRGIRIPAGSTVLGRSCEKTFGLKMHFVVDLQDRDKLQPIAPPDPLAHHDNLLFVEKEESDEPQEERRH